MPGLLSLQTATMKHPSGGKLFKYADGALRTAHKRSVDAHLVTCPGCVATIRMMRLTLLLHDNWSQLAPRKKSSSKPGAKRRKVIRVPI